MTVSDAGFCGWRSLAAVNGRTARGRDGYRVDANGRCPARESATRGGLRKQRNYGCPAPGGDVLMPPSLACFADSIIKWPGGNRATLCRGTDQSKARHSGRAGGMKQLLVEMRDRKSTRLNSSHVKISYA